MLADSAGYVVLRGKIAKYPGVGYGQGYGVAVNTKTGNRTYLEFSRIEVGWGYGVMEGDAVIVFAKEADFKRFAKGIWHLFAGADAVVQVDEQKDQTQSITLAYGENYQIYRITRTGVAATATLRLFHVKPVNGAR